jgi:hypothetical protein
LMAQFVSHFAMRRADSVLYRCSVGAQTLGDIKHDVLTQIVY